MEGADLVEEFGDLELVGGLGLFEFVHDFVEFQSDFHGFGLIFPPDQFQVQSQIIDHLTQRGILIQQLRVVFEYNLQLGLELGVQMVFGVVGLAFLIESRGVDQGTALTDGLELVGGDAVLLMGIVGAVGWLAAGGA